MIVFNQPYCTGKEVEYFSEVLNSKKLCGNGYYTNLCHQYFQKKYGFKKCLLTTSCTDALEMSALLAGISYGDEVIIPSYTFVSTALAFVRQGATIIFADSQNENPNINPVSIEKLITNKTKAIIVVHYAGFACDMDKILDITNKYNLILIEDAAQAIDSYYFSKKQNKKIPLGSIGDFGTFSFHETKNIQCGEGGMLVINNEKFFKRSEIIWEKGTNRAEFFRGEINKYGWVDIGSSFLASEYTAAFLFAQLLCMETIQNKRIGIWNSYFEGLKNLDMISTIKIPEFSSNNAHIFYLICQSEQQRSDLISWMKQHNVQLVFHYLCLHKSKFYEDYCSNGERINLPMAEYYTDSLVRLPLYYDLSREDVQKIIDLIKIFFENRR